MKVLTLCVLALAVALVAGAKYDPKNHKNGHELEVSIREDEDTIFVIMWYFSDIKDPFTEVSGYNNKNKTEISSKISTKDNVSFSMIDMSITGHAPDPTHQGVTDPGPPAVIGTVPLPKSETEDYSDLFKTINNKDFVIDPKTTALDISNLDAIVRPDPADAKDYLMMDGPIVNVIRKGKGVKISGKGLASEVAD